MSPSAIDLILGLALIFFAIKGLMAGFLRSVISFAAVLLAWYVSSTMPGLFAPLATFAASPESPIFPFISRMVAWATVFIGVQVVGFFVTGVLEKIGLRSLDKFVGLAFGALTGLSIGCFPLALIFSVPPLYSWEPVRNTLDQSVVLRAYAPIVAIFVRPPSTAKVGAGRKKELKP